MYLKTLKALLLGLCIAAMAVVSWTSSSLAAGGNLDQQVQELIQQNRALTDRLMQVEQQLSEMKAAPEEEPVPRRAGAKTVLSSIADTIYIHGLLEFGGGYYSTDMNNTGHTHGSDICVPTVALGIGAELHDWVNAEMVLLYEDYPEWSPEPRDDKIELDEAVVTIANPEVTPAFLKIGKMYVPFGAALTHFPDDPLTDAPLTLMLGEVNEHTLLIGAEWEGFTVSAYAYNGDVEEKGNSDNYIENYGFDANYAFEDECRNLDILVGGSYISNITDSDLSMDHLLYDNPYGDRVKDYAGGADAYLHIGYQGFFVDGEYMTASDRIRLSDKEGDYSPGFRPQVWNIEAGYNYNWWRNLEICLKYAGSSDGAPLGFPKQRYGINFNQEIYTSTIFSLGYMYDWMDSDDRWDRNKRDFVFSQIAVEF